MYLGIIYLTNAFFEWHQVVCDLEQTTGTEQLVKTTTYKGGPLTLVFHLSLCCSKSKYKKMVTQTIMKCK